ncbi:hypothetical protein [Butyrivibrio hungatei]|uniref:Uncharacterized protein n=1 Tax=Butyrivibrio hungatei TaxID=185008 RepID=A0A1D9P5C0_9FIRM|nr:hypothetical protein [Butyrivibrio hungatei]AOZ97816.1 hypothetical protein bhn_II017 [Butyrivibrio hungatei]
MNIIFPKYTEKDAEYLVAQLQDEVKQLSENNFLCLLPKLIIGVITLIGPLYLSIKLIISKADIFSPLALETFSSLLIWNVVNTFLYKYIFRPYIDPKLQPFESSINELYETIQKLMDLYSSYRLSDRLSSLSGNWEYRVKYDSKHNSIEEIMFTSETDYFIESFTEGLTYDNGVLSFAKLDLAYEKSAEILKTTKEIRLNKQGIKEY